MMRMPHGILHVSLKKFWYFIMGPKVMSAENTSDLKECQTSINNKLSMTKNKQAWSVTQCHDDKLFCPPPNLCSNQ